MEFSFTRIIDHMTDVYLWVKYKARRQTYTPQTHLRELYQRPYILETMHSYTLPM